MQQRGARGIVAKHPERVGAIVKLPGKMIGGSLPEIEYALDTLKMDGVSTLIGAS
jgi:hypothetical protein